MAMSSHERERRLAAVEKANMARTRDQLDFDTEDFRDVCLEGVIARGDTVGIVRRDMVGEGMSSAPDRTLEQVAAALGITRQGVHCAETSAMVKIWRAMEPWAVRELA